MIASLTTPAGDNLTPVAETIAAVGTDMHRTWLFGLSNGVAFPGDVGGGLFVGVRPSPHLNLAVGSSSGWNISADGTPGGSGTWTALFTNGATISPDFGNGNMALQMTDPTDVVAYCFGMVIEIDVSVAGTLTVSKGNVNNLSRADKAQMSAILNGTVADPTNISGGWWSSSVAVACQYLLMRWPLSLNSMRVHNYDAIQLA
jgi:hypothetical protein